MTEDFTFEAHELVALAAACLRAHGVADDDARIAAEALVGSDVRGVHSHGLLLLPRYCHLLRQGGVVARPAFTTVREGPATALVDGGAGLGQVTAVKAMRLAMSKATTHGVGIVSVRNSHHFGAAAHYATLAIERGMIGFASTNAGVTMTAPGAGQRLIGNNPIAFAVPNDAYPVVLDMAMSHSSGGRIRRMADAGESLPLGWVVDDQGRDTIDPKDYDAGGALLPIGGHKGFGLALMVEILSAVLAGAATTTDVRIDQLEPGSPAGIGHLLAAIDIAAFRSVEEFGRDLEGLLAKIASPVSGGGMAHVPGSGSARRVARAREGGVSLPGDVVRALRQLVADLPIDRPRGL